jgi:hypothetical protein
MRDMVLNRSSIDDGETPRRYSGRWVVFWMFAFVIAFGMLFWLGIVYFILPRRG